MNLLSREVCIKALDCLSDDDKMDELAQNFSMDDDYVSHANYEIARKWCYDQLKECIDEHFDNPPLTLDELYEFVKQDMDYHYLPVWDNKFGGQWFVLENINGNKLKFKGYDHPIEFEEGRYYRKEVQECN